MTHNQERTTSAEFVKSTLKLYLRAHLLGMPDEEFHDLRQYLTDVRFTLIDRALDLACTSEPLPRALELLDDRTLSFHAKNVEVQTNNGKVTLRGDRIARREPLGAEHPRHGRGIAHGMIGASLQAFDDAGTAA